MFESYTQEYLLGKMLEKGKEIGVNCIEGSLVYNAACLMAVMLEDAFDKAEEIYINGFEDTCDREHLIRFARCKGLEPKSATPAIVSAESDTLLKIGARLTNGRMSFVVTSLEGEAEGIYTYTLTSTVVGEEYSEEMNALEVEEYIENFGYCTITGLVKQAEPEEDTEVFRQRYFDAYGVPGQFGNEAYYRQLAKSIDGVGAVRIKPGIRFETGEKSISIYPVSESFASVEHETFNRLDELFKIYAPIDHVVDVMTVLERPLDINIKMELDSGAVLSDVKALVEENIDKYIRSVNSGYEKNEKRIIYIRKIESAALDAAGVLDCTVTGTTYNGLSASPAKNIEIDELDLVKRGNVSYV